MIVNVGTTSTSLLGAEVRKSIMLANRGSVTVWCRFHSGADAGSASTAAAVVDEGFPLDAGDKLVLEDNQGSIHHPLLAIAESGTADISVYPWS